MVGAGAPAPAAGFSAMVGAGADGRGGPAIGGGGGAGAGGGSVGEGGRTGEAPGTVAAGEAGGASAALRVTRTVSFFNGTLDVCLDGAGDCLSFSLMRARCCGWVGRSKPSLPGCVNPSIENNFVSPEKSPGSRIWLGAARRGRRQCGFMGLCRHVPCNSPSSKRSVTRMETSKDCGESSWRLSALVCHQRRLLKSPMMSTVGMPARFSGV